MAIPRDVQDLELVIIQKPPHAEDIQEIILVIGPAMTFTTPTGQQHPKVCVNT